MLNLNSDDDDDTFLGFLPHSIIQGYICLGVFFFLLKNFLANAANCFLEAENTSKALKDQG